MNTKNSVKNPLNHHNFQNLISWESIRASFDNTWKNLKADLTKWDDSIKRRDYGETMGKGRGRKRNEFLQSFPPYYPRSQAIPKIPPPTENRTREITRTKRILILTKSTLVKILESARGQAGEGDNDIKSTEVIPLPAGLYNG